jgi:hypothetical protein
MLILCFDSAGLRRTHCTILTSIGNGAGADIADVGYRRRVVVVVPEIGLLQRPHVARVVVSL